MDLTRSSSDSLTVTYFTSNAKGYGVDPKNLNVERLMYLLTTMWTAEDIKWHNHLTDIK